jgi:hypothetical protein
MKIELRQARSHEFPILERLMQLYLYDFAAIDDWPIADDGRYGNAATIESFWKDPQMSSFFVRVDGVLAGFVLVRDGAYFAGEGPGTSASSSSCAAIAAGASAARSPAGCSTAIRASGRSPSSRATSTRRPSGVG